MTQTDVNVAMRLFDKPGEFSTNQFAEQWFAYRMWRLGFDYPHTLNRGTHDAALRKEFRL
jgi:hypothetical protein